MDKLWDWLAVELGKYARWVALGVVALTVVLGFGITRLEFATGQDSYLNTSDEIYQDNVEYQSLFGGSAMLVLITMDDGHTVDELLEPDAQAQFDTLHDRLTESGRFVSVITPRTALQFSHNLLLGPEGEDGSRAIDPVGSVIGQAVLGALGREAPDSPEFQARQADAGETLARLGEVPEDERTMDNPTWLSFLLHDNEGEIRRPTRQFVPDTTHAQIIVRLQGNLSIEDEGADARLVEEAGAALDFENASVVATGAPVFLRDLNDYLRGGMLTLGALAVVFMIIVLLVFFTVRWRLLPLIVILIGVTWAFGLAGYLGIPLTVITIAGLPVMLGVGIDYVIQMHARAEEEIAVNRHGHPIQETARNLGPALLVVTFDAIFAFLALRFAKVPMLRDFGLLLAIGIAVICIGSIVLPLAALGIREYKSPTKVKPFTPGYLGRFTEWLGTVPARLAPFLIVASIVIFVGGMLVEEKLTLETDPIRWVNQSSQTIDDIRTVEREAGSANELGTFIRATGANTSVFTDEYAQYLHDFTRDMLDANPEVLQRASSLEEVVGGTLFVPGASDLAPTGDDLRRAFDVAPDDIRNATIAHNGQAANLVFPVRPSSIEEWQPITDEMRDENGAPTGLDVTPAGLAVVGVGLLENLEANRIFLTYLAMVFVFLFLAVRLRSIIRSALSLVPVAIAVGAASLIAWAFDLTLSPMTAAGGPLIIAACTEFTSLILLRFVEERNRGLDPKEAIDVTAQRTGKAFIVSGMTAIIGVAVLSLSSLPLLRDFGQIVAMNVAVALFSALVILPPMLVWAEQRGWVTRGLLRKQPDFIPVPDYHPEGVDVDIEANVVLEREGPAPA